MVGTQSALTPLSVRGQNSIWMNSSWRGAGAAWLAAAELPPVAAHVPLSSKAAGPPPRAAFAARSGADVLSVAPSESEAEKSPARSAFESHALTHCSALARHPFKSGPHLKQSASSQRLSS